MSEPRPRGALRRLLGQLLFASAGIAAIPVAAASPGDDSSRDADDVIEDVVEATLDLADDRDPVAGGHALAILLEHLTPLDATRTAATAALSVRPEIRCAIGEALTWTFPLVGASTVIDHLSRDLEPAVRLAAVRAAHARRTTGGDGDVLVRLTGDVDPTVASAAVLALGR